VQGTACCIIAHPHVPVQIPTCERVSQMRNNAGNRRQGTVLALHRATPLQEQGSAAQQAACITRTPTAPAPTTTTAGLPPLRALL